ncbi:MAG: hypothetical protein HZR80_16440 [Candidatus Heimdallarchaeota archaeon]
MTKKKNMKVKKSFILAGSNLSLGYTLELFLTHIAVVPSAVGIFDKK